MLVRCAKFSLLLCGLLSVSACVTEMAPQSPQQKPALTSTLPPKAEKNIPTPIVNNTSLTQWVAGFKTEARQKGISDALLQQAFADFQPIEKVIRLDRKQPEGTFTFAQYTTKVITQQRIDQGRKLLEENRADLERISAQYGVQPEYIVALWGMETSYGKITGGYNVVQSLATLAYEGRRAAFFRAELLKALQIIDAGHIQYADMKGSWAGAMGQCQFMPTSFLNFAQDANGDGHKDIWKTKLDVFASIANYLHTEGWNGSKTWGREVTVPPQFDVSLAGRTKVKPLHEWKRLGVMNKWGGPLPSGSEQASLIFPDDSHSRAFLVYGNYKVIMKWNRSLYFATSVGMLADLLNKQP